MCPRRRKQNSLSTQTTLPYHRAPAFLRFNPFIKKGYRSKLTTTQCFHSVLSWNNETLNIWSHVAGFLIFLGLFVYDVTVVVYKIEGTQYDFGVVAFVLLSFMLCMLLSSLYHTLNCRSEESCRRWLSYDIFGISASFLAIFLSGLYYGFWCPDQVTIRYMYMALVGGLFIVAMIFLLNPRLMGVEWDLVRVCLFSCWAASGLLPTFHWVILHGGLNGDIVKIFLPRIFIMYGISIIAVIIYLWKIPERYFPGCFDFVGASHQLWHLTIVVALVYWHQTGLQYASFRLLYGCNLTAITP